jgi:hypothetical protein
MATSRSFIDTAAPAPLKKAPSVRISLTLASARLLRVIDFHSCGSSGQHLKQR